MSATTAGLLHPGAMGSSVGAALRQGGARVVWAGEGRSDATRQRAEKADLEDAGDLTALAAASEIVFSICPPDAARTLARDVLKAGFRGIYVDANAVSPDTARAIAGILEAAGATYVDGGIIGPPAQRPGSTRLYLSGAGAGEIIPLFRSGPLEAIRIPGPCGAASALKICFASYTKGNAALLTAVRALAIHEGVDAALLEEWNHSLPDLPARSEGSARATAPKAWRFVGEMEEIAATYAAAGLPDGFHLAAAEIYRRLSVYKDEEPPSVGEISGTLLDKH